VTRTIRKSELEGRRYWNADGIPMFEEPRQTPEIIVNPPEITLTPNITVEAPAVTVEAPNMQPVADAISQMQTAILDSIGSIQPPNITVEPQAAPDMTPIADAMLLLADAVHSKPDHVGEITAMLQKIADRPTTAQWSFNITRDNHGNISDIKAIKEQP